MIRSRFPSISSSRSFFVGLLWVAPWLIGASLFLFLPMLMSLYYSFCDYPILKPPVYIGFDNYARMLDDPRLLNTVKNTLLFALLFIPLATALALALAALLADSSPAASPSRSHSASLRFAKTFRAAIFIPTLVPLVASAMIWRWLFNAEFGLINLSLAKLGLQGPDWLGGSWAIPALVLASLWTVGQQVIVYIAALRDVPRSLYEAAQLDGMSPLRRFFSITLPLISPAILFNSVTLTINTLQVFAVPYILFRDERGQREAGDFFNLYLYDNAFVYQQMGYASAMAWIQLLFVLALTALMFALSQKLVHYRA